MHSAFDKCADNTNRSCVFSALQKVFNQIGEIKGR